MTKTNGIRGIVALLILLTGLGCAQVKNPEVGKIDYRYFHLCPDRQSDGSLVMTFTYTGPTELKNVSFYPFVMKGEGILAWVPDPLWQTCETWKPGETKVITTDKRYDPKTKELYIKLVLSAEFEGKTVYVTKNFHVDGTPF